MSKKIFLIGSLTTMFLLGGVLRAVEEKLETGIITGSRVNVRARPLGTAEICCQLRMGDAVEILERRHVVIIGTNTEEWVRIVLPQEANVWIQSDLLDPLREESSEASKEGVVKGAVKSRTNGRAGPGLKWPVLGVLSKGESVTVRTNATDWVGVPPTRQMSGWVSGHYIGEKPVAVPASPVKEP